MVLKKYAEIQRIKELKIAKYSFWRTNKIIDI